MSSSNARTDPTHANQPLHKPLLVGLFGQNILQSLSPAMHAQEARHHGLALHYQLMEFTHMNAGAGAGIEALPAMLHAVREIGFAGINVTYPFKQAILPLLDAISPEAQAIGAVNTVVFKDGRATGYNTDGYGFGTALDLALIQSGKRAALGRTVLVGTGGAGAAVAHALLKLGASQLTLLDTDATKAQALAANLRAHYAQERIACATVASSEAQAAIAAADGFVNATPIGMYSHPGLCVPTEWIKPNHWVADVVYSPLNTQLLQVAAAKGCATIAGSGMAVWQGVQAFELFTGIAPDSQRMGAHFIALLAQRGQ